MLRGKENKMKSCVKFVCSKVKQSAAAAAIQPAPYSQCRLRNCLPGRKGIFCKMERTQFTQYILGKVFAPSPFIQNMFSHKEHLSNAYAQFAAPVQF
jgi:hypothetical protein